MYLYTYKLHVLYSAQFTTSMSTKRTCLDSVAELLPDAAAVAVSGQAVAPAPVSAVESAVSAAGGQ